jgi:hypothetical protein
MARQSEHLDQAEEALRELREYDDWDEPTARTDVHVHMHSEHDGDEEPAKKPAKWWQLAIGATVTAALAWVAKHFGR